jgi:hypothetical protein
MDYLARCCPSSRPTERGWRVQFHAAVRQQPAMAKSLIERSFPLSKRAVGTPHTLVASTIVSVLLRRDSLYPCETYNRMSVRRGTNPPRLVFFLLRGFLPNKALLGSLKSSLSLCDGREEIADVLTGWYN